MVRLKAVDGEEYTFDSATAVFEWAEATTTDLLSKFDLTDNEFMTLQDWSERDNN